MSRYQDISESFRVHQGRPTSYFKIDGIPNFASKDVSRDFLDDLNNSLPGRDVKLKFVFVKDPLRLTLGHQWRETGEDHPLCQSFREALNLNYERAHRHIVHEVCFLEVSTEPQKEYSAYPNYEHDHAVERVLRIFDRTLIHPCRWADYDEELSRPAKAVEILPSDHKCPRSFETLTNYVSLSHPWRMTLTIDTDAERARRLVKKATHKSMWLSLILGKKRAKNPYQQLLDNRDYQDRWVTAKVGFETWGGTPADEYRNLSQMSGTISAAGMFGLVKGEVVDLAEAIGLMPITRPGSPWDTGEVLFRTADGKLFPFAPRSNQHPRPTEAVFYKRDEEADAYHQAINSGLIAGHNTPPLIARIKIGAGADHFLGLVAKELQEHDKGLVGEFCATPDASFTVNILDTALGMRKPESDAMEAATLLTVLLNTKSNEFEEPFLWSLLPAVIVEAYSHFSDDQCPKQYAESACPVVDTALNESGLPAPATWWEAMDLLHGQKRHKEAELAQRHAVPVLADLIWILKNNHRIRDTFGGMSVCCSDAPMIDYVAQKLDEVIRAWPSLSAPTNFDVGGARLSTISVVEGAPIKGLDKSQVTCVLYLLARKALCSMYFNDPAPYMFGGIDERYVGYHRDRCHADVARVRKICYSNADAVVFNKHVMMQLAMDIRESRKLDIMVTVDSKDYGIPREIFDYSSCIASLSPEGLSDEDWRLFSGHSMPLPYDRPQWAPGGLNVLLTAGLKSHRHIVQQHLVLLGQQKNVD